MKRLWRWLGYVWAEYAGDLFICLLIAIVFAVATAWASRYIGSQL